MGTCPPATEQHRRPTAALMCAGLLATTTGQLLTALLLPHLPQFRSKAFGARAVAYPLAMLAVPVVHWLRHRHRPAPRPWVASALVMVPFFIDMTSNSLDMYNRIVWWDDACHFVNWAFLLAGLGMLIDPLHHAPRMVRGLAIAGLGAILAIVWELGEWFTFIRFGTARASAYTDTLGDLTLGTLGSTLAALLLTRGRRAS